MLTLKKIYELQRIPGKSIITVMVAFCAMTGCALRADDSADNNPPAFLTERACLERVMFFESNRSSRDGPIAVGTVVMNRVNSSAYPNTICQVVGQANQFAPGALTRPINMQALPDIREAADAVLKGERDAKLKNAMFFHTAGLTFPYTNMHYVRVAGGNAFYEKRGRDGRLQVPGHDSSYDVAFAYGQEKQQRSPSSTTPPPDAAVTKVASATVHSVSSFSAPPKQGKIDKIGAILLAQHKQSLRPIVLSAR